MAERLVRIVIAGGSGLIGRALCREFSAAGTQTIVLSRTARPVPGAAVLAWTPASPGPWCSALAGADVLINLCGTSIGQGRWTAARKRELLASRVVPAETLAQACASLDTPPRTLIQASGVGFYGASIGAVPAAARDERAGPGADFLAELAVAWEAAGLETLPNGIRRVVARMGVVWSRHGGALMPLVRPFRFGAGGRLGAGTQPMAWIHEQDLVQAYRHLIDNSVLSGPVNLVAPDAPTNSTLAEIIARLLRRPNLFAVPAPLLRLLLGEMATLVLEGQRVAPRVLLDSGFEFRYPDAESALRSLL